VNTPPSGESYHACASRPTGQYQSAHIFDVLSFTRSTDMTTAPKINKLVSWPSPHPSGSCLSFQGIQPILMYKIWFGRAPKIKLKWVTLPWPRGAPFGGDFIDGIRSWDLHAAYNVAYNVLMCRSEIIYSLTACSAQPTDKEVFAPAVRPLQLVELSWVEYVAYQLWIL